jgi:hypothetical protein
VAWARNIEAANIDDELVAANIERTSSLNCANPNCELLRHSERPTARDPRPRTHCCSRCYQLDPRNAARELGYRNTSWRRFSLKHDSHCEGLSKIAITVTDH